MKKTTALSLTEALRIFIQDSTQGRRKISAAKPVSHGTITNYQYCLRLIKLYEAHAGKLLNIPMTQRKAANPLSTGHRWWKSFYRHFTQFLLQHLGCSDNYAANNLKTLKTAMRYLQIEKGWPISQGYQQAGIARQQSLPIVLSPEQMHQLIYDTAFEENLGASLRKAKDLIVFGCSTGLRISDLQRLRKTAVSIVGEDAYLQCYTQKTGNAVQLVLPDYCMAIL
ncbi:MAG TPA: hypothetical protein VFM18_24480, partial [Methanosarcina sp.]|nr:hypothetical protein [Methanosarcina sp.]